MNSNKTLKQVLLVLLIVTVLIAAFFNISTMIELLKNLSGGNLTSVHPTVGSLIGNICSYFNIALFVFIIFFYGYKKTNLFWILLPYLGSIIFGLMKLLEKKDSNEKE